MEYLKNENQKLSNKIKLLELELEKSEVINKILAEENEQLKQSVVNPLNYLIQTELDTANKEIFELKQIISLLEHVVEEVSKDNLSQQKIILEISNTSAQTRLHKVNSTFSGSHNNPSKRTKISVAERNKKEMDSMSNEHSFVNVGGRHVNKMRCKCGKQYSTKRGLRRHIFIGKNGRIFRCTDCERKFTTHANLRYHMRNFHKKTTYNGHGCRRCGKVFRNRSEINVHIATEH